MNNCILDHIDKKILNRIQRNFPISQRPYYEIASELNITEEEVIERIAQLKETGFIRRLGGVFDSRRLGYTSTLCAMRVPNERIHTVANLINSYSGVTHNYLRNHTYNIWFTCIAPSEEELNNTLEDMKQKSGITDLINLPAIDFFKIKADFTVKEDVL